MKCKKMNEVIKNSVGLRGTIPALESYFHVAFSKHVKADFEMVLENDSCDPVAFFHVSDFMYEYTFSITLLPTIKLEDGLNVYYVTGAKKLDKAVLDKGVKE